VFTGGPDTTGHYPVQTSFWSYLKATPKGAAESSSGSGTGIGFGGVVVVVLVAAGAMVLYRRSTQDDRE
jgi:peptide/nickel transport system substrate-binding protein